MCRHVVTYAEFNCGHQYPLRREQVDCNRSWCALSVSHNLDEHDHQQCATQMNPDLNLVMPGFSYSHPCNSCLGLPVVPGNGTSGLHAHQNGSNSDDEDDDEQSDESNEPAGENEGHEA